MSRSQIAFTLDTARTMIEAVWFDPLMIYLVDVGYTFDMTTPVFPDSGNIVGSADLTNVRIENGMAKANNVLVSNAEGGRTVTQLVLARGSGLPPLFVLTGGNVPFVSRAGAFWIRWQSGGVFLL